VGSGKAHTAYIGEKPVIRGIKFKGGLLTRRKSTKFARKMGFRKIKGKRPTRSANAWAGGKEVK